MADEKAKWEVDAKPDEALLFKQSALFLVNFREHGNKTRAARDAGFRNTEYINFLIRTDKEFADAYFSAVEARKDNIRNEIYRRAIQGVKKPIYHGGEHIKDKDGMPAYETVYSDGLAIAVARAEIPEEYGEKAKVEHHHTGRVGVAVLPMRAISDEEYQRELDALDASQKRALPAPAQDVKDAEFTEVPAAQTTVEIRRG